MTDRWVDPDYIEWLEAEVVRLQEIVDILTSNVNLIDGDDAVAHID